MPVAGSGYGTFAFATPYKLGLDQESYMSTIGRSGSPINSERPNCSLENWMEFANRIVDKHQLYYQGNADSRYVDVSGCVYKRPLGDGSLERFIPINSGSNLVSYPVLSSGFWEHTANITDYLNRVTNFDGHGYLDPVGLSAGTNPKLGYAGTMRRLYHSTSIHSPKLKYTNLTHTVGCPGFGRYVSTPTWADYHYHATKSSYIDIMSGTQYVTKNEAIQNFDNTLINLSDYIATSGNLSGSHSPRCGMGFAFFNLQSYRVRALFTAIVSSVSLQIPIRVFGLQNVSYRNATGIDGFSDFYSTFSRVNIHSNYDHNEYNNRPHSVDLHYSSSIEKSLELSVKMVLGRTDSIQNIMSEIVNENYVEANLDTFNEMLDVRIEGENVLFLAAIPYPLIPDVTIIRTDISNGFRIADPYRGITKSVKLAITPYNQFSAETTYPVYNMMSYGDSFFIKGRTPKSWKDMAFGVGQDQVGYGSNSAYYSHLDSSEPPNVVYVNQTGVIANLESNNYTFGVDNYRQAILMYGYDEESNVAIPPNGDEFYGQLPESE